MEQPLFPASVAQRRKKAYEPWGCEFLFLRMHAETAIAGGAHPAFVAARCLELSYWCKMHGSELLSPTWDLLADQLEAYGRGMHLALSYLNPARIREVLEGPCSSYCMDNEVDRELASRILATSLRSPKS